MNSYERGFPFHDQKGVYFKIDWMTTVWLNSSISEIVDFFYPYGPDFPVDEFSVINHQYYERFINGMGNTCCFVLPAMNIYIQCNSILDLNITDESFYINRFSKIRVDMSGGKLDYLRQQGQDFEKLFFSGTLPENAHYTRIDAAFDYINFKPRLFDDLVDFLQQYGVRGRIGVGSAGARQFEIHSGREEIIYIGSGQNILRCYDKKLEFDQKDKWDPEDIHPECWHRLEWQLRSNSLKKVLSTYVIDTPQHFFEALYQSWMLRPPLDDYHQRVDPICQAWVDLFDFDNDRLVIQNLQYVYDTPVVCNLDYVHRTLDKYCITFALCIAALGREEVINYIENKINSLRASTKANEYLRLYRFKRSLLELCSDFHTDSITQLPGLAISQSGAFVFLHLKDQGGVINV